MSMARTKINWKDKSLVLFGGDLEKKIKAAASKSEPQFKNVGQEVGLRVWRIEQFVAKPWTMHGKVSTVPFQTESDIVP